MTALASLSIYLQTRFLYKRIEYHLLGNHLFANIKALIFSGLFFNTKESNSWLNKALTLLSTELNEQILRDGGHFELSPMYHSIILEDLLDLINITRVYEFEIPVALNDIINKMFVWLQAMLHPDGNIAFFNDATLGVAPTFTELNAYADRLGISTPKLEYKSLYTLPDSQYHIIQNKRIKLIIDTANIGPDYIPGHAHADTLSFECSIDKQRLFVNSGISCYGTSNERIRQRGTATHNTLTICDANSSDVWSGFRVGQRARVLSTNIQNTNNDVTLISSHDGYNHKKYGYCIHARTWHLSDEKLHIKDELTGQAIQQKIKVYFYLYPSLKCSNDGDAKLMILDKNDGEIASFSVINKNVKLSLVDSTYHPGFAATVHNQCILIELIENLPSTIEYELRWV